MRREENVAPKAPIETNGLARSVSETASHLFGNLFQRLYAFAEEARRGQIPDPEQLVYTVSRLEDALRAVFDFFDLGAGRTTSVLTLRAEEVVGSLHACLRSALPSGLHVDAEVEVPDQQLAIDPLCLKIAGQALARVLQISAESRVLPLAGKRCGLRAGCHNRALWVEVQLPAGWGECTRAESGLWWAVAVRALERQMGKLTCDGNDLEGTVWRIEIPLWT